eukprot:3230210-Pyramimonas_sp.AAC.1
MRSAWSNLCERICSQTRREGDDTKSLHMRNMLGRGPVCKSLIREGVHDVTILPELHVLPEQRTEVLHERR